MSILREFTRRPEPPQLTCHTCGTKILPGCLLAGFDFRDGHDNAPRRFCSPLSSSVEGLTVVSSAIHTPLPGL